MKSILYIVLTILIWSGLCFSELIPLCDTDLDCETKWGVFLKDEPFNSPKFKIARDINQACNGGLECIRKQIKDYEDHILIQAIFEGD